MKKERKDVFIIVRCTKSEKASLLKRAGRNLSRFIRDLLGFK
jgi:hypothetical protein